MGGSSSDGRASAFQAEGRGFEPRLPLHFFPSGSLPLANVIFSLRGVCFIANVIFPFGEFALLQT
jgi:hypothetical protein